MSALEQDDDLELLTAEDVAKLFHVPVTWVYQQIRGRGKRGAAMPNLKLGRYIRFQEHAVREWLETQKRNYRPRKGR